MDVESTPSFQRVVKAGQLPVRDRKVESLLSLRIRELQLQLEQLLVRNREIEVLRSQEAGLLRSRELELQLKVEQLLAHNREVEFQLKAHNLAHAARRVAEEKGARWCVPRFRLAPAMPGLVRVCRR
jgi:hypothetical protein